MINSPERTLATRPPCEKSKAEEGIISKISLSLKLSNVTNYNYFIGEKIFSYNSNFASEGYSGQELNFVAEKRLTGNF